MIIHSNNHIKSFGQLDDGAVFGSCGKYYIKGYYGGNPVATNLMSGEVLDKNFNTYTQVDYYSDATLEVEGDKNKLYVD
jgi:hypothetical protein